MLDPPFFGRSCRDCGPVSLGKTGGWGGGSPSALEGHGRDELLHLVGQPLLPRLLVLLQGGCDLLQKRENWDQTTTKKTRRVCICYRIRPGKAAPANLCSHADIAWKKKKGITSLPSSLTTRRDSLCISLFPVLSCEPISCMFGICQVGFKRYSDRLPPPLLLCALIWCLPCQDESVSEWHRHTWQRPFNMNIKQERTLRHAPRFHHLRYRSLEPNAATPSLRRQLRLLVDQVYKNYSRLERSIWLNHWLLTQNDKLTRLMQ